MWVVNNWLTCLIYLNSLLAASEMIGHLSNTDVLLNIDSSILGFYSLSWKQRYQSCRSNREKKSRYSMNGSTTSNWSLWHSQNETFWLFIMAGLEIGTNWNLHIFNLNCPIFEIEIETEIKIVFCWLCKLLSSLLYWQLIVKQKLMRCE